MQGAVLHIFNEEGSDGVDSPVRGRRRWLSLMVGWGVLSIVFGGDGRRCYCLVMIVRRESREDHGGERERCFSFLLACLPPTPSVAVHRRLRCLWRHPVRCIAVETIGETRTQGSTAVAVARAKQNNLGKSKWYSRFEAVAALSLLVMSSAGPVV